MESNFGCSETLSEKKYDAAPEPRIAYNMEQSITGMHRNRQSPDIRKQKKMDMAEAGFLSADHFSKA